MSQKVMITRVATVLLMGMALTGCSTMKGWFAGKDAAAKKAQEPAELVKFEPTVKVSKAWSVNLGKGERRIGVRQARRWPTATCSLRRSPVACTPSTCRPARRSGPGSRRRKRRRRSCACPAARVSVRTWS
jgi:predicted small secreted protein